MNSRWKIIKTETNQEITHKKLNKTIVLELSTNFKEEVLQDLFENKLTDRDIFLLLKQLNSN